MDTEHAVCFNWGKLPFFRNKIRKFWMLGFGSVPGKEFSCCFYQFRKCFWTISYLLIIRKIKTWLYGHVDKYAMYWQIMVGWACIPAESTDYFPTCLHLKMLNLIASPLPPGPWDKPSQTSLVSGVQQQWQENDLNLACDQVQWPQHSQKQLISE